MVVVQCYYSLVAALRNVISFFRREYHLYAYAYLCGDITCMRMPIYATDTVGAVFNDRREQIVRPGQVGQGRASSPQRARRCERIHTLSAHHATKHHTTPYHITPHHTTSHHTPRLTPRTPSPSAPSWQARTATPWSKGTSRLVFVEAVGVLMREAWPLKLPVEAAI